MKRVQLALSAVCTLCFTEVPAGGYGFLNSDSMFECPKCQREAERVAKVKADEQ
jgi:hypothetical protein